MENLKQLLRSGKMENMTFEQAMTRLEDIVKKLEDHTVSLDDSVALFQEGVQLSKFCSDKLSSVEEKVSQIMIDGELKEFKIED